MKPITPEIDWDDILEKLAAYDGTIASFCKKYNVNQHRLYYQRKKANSSDTSFYPLSFATSAPTKAIIIKETIDITIGKATLKIQMDDTEYLRLVLKTLLELC
jgi:hypothetical protein